MARVPAFTEEQRAYFAREGRKGGKARLKSTTPEQRQKQARKAAEARWKKATKRIDASLASARKSKAESRPLMKELGSKMRALTKGSKRLLATIEENARLRAKKHKAQK